jgi:hypothetical protein
MDTRTVRAIVKFAAAVSALAAFWIAAELSPEFKTYGTLAGYTLLLAIALIGGTLNVIAWLRPADEETHHSRAPRPDDTPHPAADPRAAR